MAGNWWSDAFANPKFRNVLSEMGQDLGYGLANSTNFGNAFGVAAQRGAQMQPYRDQMSMRAEEKAKTEEMRKRYSETLAGWGGEYADLAEGVAAGGLDPAQAYMTAWERRYKPQTGPEGFTLGAGEVRYDGAGNVIAEGAPDQGDAFGYEKDLYSQYTAAPPVKLYQEVKSGFERVRTSAVQNTGAGDVGLVYGYMKMLDPGSVVREGEFATAESTAGLPQQIVGLYNKLISGERLTPSQKAQFVQAAEGLYDETVTNLQGVNDQFSTRAQGWKVNPSNFLVQPESFGPLDMGGGAPRTTSTGVTWSY